MPDHPAATGDTAGDTVTDAAAEAPVPSEGEISRRMRLRARWLTVICAVATLVAGSAVSLLANNQTQGRYVDAVAIERQGDEEEVPSGGTASFIARLAAPSDKVRLVVDVQPADAPVTCEPRTVDVVVRAAGVPGGAWRQRYPGRLGPTFEAGVRVSERADTVSVAVTPHAGTQADACAYETDLLVVESARTPLLWVTLLGAGIAVVGGLVVALLVYLKRDVLRRPPWLGPAADMQRARARERAAERAIEDALRHGRGRPPEPRWPADDEALEPVAGTGGTREAGGPGPRSGPDTGADALVLADLWTVTHARLDKYHGIAQTQARHAFRNAQVAMGIGFGMLVGFTVLALIADNTATSIVAGVLGASSAALAGFIGRTFVRSQESTVETLRAYFTQPLEFSRYLAAERLVDGVDLTREQRAEILGAIAQAIVAQPGAVPQDPQQQQPSGNGR